MSPPADGRAWDEERGPDWMPTEPLLEILRERSKRYPSPTDDHTDGNLRELSRVLADRMGKTFEAVNRQFWRMVGGQRWIRYDIADEWAIALGMHPAEIWGWERWGSPTKPERHICEHCGRTYVHAKSLRSHVDDKHGEEGAA